MIVAATSDVLNAENATISTRRVPEKLESRLNIRATITLAQSAKETRKKL
jgi:hypothetical protein